MVNKAPARRKHLWLFSFSQDSLGSPCCCHTRGEASWISPLLAFLLWHLPMSLLDTVGDAHQRALFLRAPKVCLSHTRLSNNPGEPVSANSTSGSFSAARHQVMMNCPS